MRKVVVHYRLGVALILVSWLACSADDTGVVAGNPSPVGVGGAPGGAAPDAGAVPGGDPIPGLPFDAGQPVYDSSVLAPPDTGPGTCAARAVKAGLDTAVEPADIIFAIDSSGSMDEEIEFVQREMNQFSQQISRSGIDVRVILIGEEDSICIGAPLGSGSCPEDTRLPGYLHVDSRVGSNDGLNVILESYRSWSPQLRANASKSFVIITDDEASSRPNNSAAEFTRNLLALDAAMFTKWTFNGIFVQQDCDEGERIGQVYADLVQQTQGVSGDLCLQNFQPVFDRLSQKIITSSAGVIACNWDIPAAPPGEVLDYGSVNIRYVEKSGATATLGKVPTAADCPKFVNGWYYDNEDPPKAILACPQSCRQLRVSGVTEVDVLLGCKSEPPPPLL